MVNEAASKEPDPAESLLCLTAKEIPRSAAEESKHHSQSARAHHMAACPLRGHSEKEQ